MPGVPVEMKAIMEDEVLPEIRANSTLEIAHFTILTSGEGETTIENQIRDIVQALPENISVAYLPALGQVRLRITGKDKIGNQITQKVEDISQQISQRLGNLVYGYNTSSLEAELIQTCRKYNLSICTAESCTGGAVAAKIVSIPGASDVFAGGLVCYSNQLKTSLLGVPAELLAQYGAVSEETVIAMMKGAIIKLGVSAAVAISGIAGPDGGSAEKPVGTIWICIGNGNSFITHQLRAGKDRKSNIELAVTTSLRIFRKWILETYR
jgi:nicotinamide-nucleotide amidase